MKRAAKHAVKWLAIALGMILLVGLAAPYLSANHFAPRIRGALETALGRKVEIGSVHFSLFAGPGFSADNVVIHENPDFGAEPIAYVDSLEAVPRLISLFAGKLEIASIRLDDASINLAKTGAPSDPGRWNFESLLNRSVIRAIPEVHIRSGRINFRFGYHKSVFYLTNTDLDISPPSRGESDWNIDFSGEPARTDKPAHGFGSFIARGRWIQSGAGKLDLDVRLERSAIGEIIELVHGNDAGVNGGASASLHLAGPLDDIHISGLMNVEDVHRWDVMPPYRQHWPFRLAGKLNLAAQTIELESSTAGGETLPLAVRVRCANYLSDPHWAVALNWNRFPVGPILELARHMGAQLPPKLQMSGSVDGVIGFSTLASMQGELTFHDASITIPDSPPIRAQNAQLIFDRGHARVTPATVQTASEEVAQVEADFDWNAGVLDLTVTTEAMRVESLRAQVQLAAVPWLDNLPSGSWRGQLRYLWSGTPASAPPETLATRGGWSGKIDVTEAQIPVPGLADPVALESAAVHIDGPRVTIDHFRAQAGKISFQGDYRYEPQLPRPHRLRLSIPEADAAELERLFLPTLRHSSLIARALNLGRTVTPPWLAGRHADATLQIGRLKLGEAEATAVRTHLLWDATRAEFDGIRAHMAGGEATGTLLVALRGRQPSYRWEGSAQAIDWKSGKVDAEGVLESSGTGSELLARLHSSGTFAARGLEMEALPDLESVSGAYDVSWISTGPRFSFPVLQLVSGSETYSGQGTTQPDGRLLIQLSGAGKEMHMSGTLAELRVDGS